MSIIMRKKEITPADILPLASYATQRAALRQEIVRKKKNRRIEVGPCATFYFECYETMLQQVQEMLYIEKGGADQVADELSATLQTAIQSLLSPARIPTTQGGGNQGGVGATGGLGDQKGDFRQMVDVGFAAFTLAPLMHVFAAGEIERVGDQEGIGGHVRYPYSPFTPAALITSSQRV